nr:protein DETOXIFICATION 16-like isoform X3 [Physcomitrium patens]|eukprot:XP_024390353.1 protein DETOXIFICATION 16-like isoform X3 [Physcomitrella patens]
MLLSKQRLVCLGMTLIVRCCVVHPLADSGTVSLSLSSVTDSSLHVAIEACRGLVSECKSSMTIGEDFMEPLKNGDVYPPSITPTVFTVVDNYSSVIRTLSDGLGNNPVGHDVEAKGMSKWVWGEVREQLWLAGPIMVMYAMQYIMTMGGVVFVGHLGAFSLAAMTLANSFCGITGYTILTGLASALETLCGQAHGAKQYDLLGIYLQRAVFILTLVALPIGLVWLNMARILVAVGEDPVIAEAAQTFTYLLYPILIMFGVLMPLIKFFQTQGAVFQLMVSMGLVAVLHVGLCWLFIDIVGFGLHGAAMAMNISIFINLCLLFAFVRFSPRFENTFTSFSMEAFKDFGEFLRLAVPSATMMCLETWSYEILTLLSGLIPNAKLNVSSFTICFGLLSLANLTAQALGVATSVRVSNELGAGKAHAARSAVAVSVSIGLANGVSVASSIYLLRDVWGNAFTSDLEVSQLVAHTAPYLAVLAVLYACQAVLSGVLAFLSGPSTLWKGFYSEEE